MKKLFAFVLFLLMCIASYTQSVTLTFTGRDADSNYCQLNRVVITNLSRGWQEILTWPDTILTLQDGVGVMERVASNGLLLSQNNPNPFDGTTFVTLSVTEVGAVNIKLLDVNGRTVGTRHFVSLQCGTHQFRLSVADVGVYFLVAQQNGKSSSIKMVNNASNINNTIDYQGIVNENILLKNGAKGISTQPFVSGDLMEYVGYSTINATEVESQRIMQPQDSSQNFILHFTVAPIVHDGDPCPGAPTVTDIDGNIYNTVTIGTQCWMKENLKTTRYADSTLIPFGSTTYSSTLPYWYYPGSDENNKDIYGLLYNWKAVMGNESSSNHNPSRVQGICPNGWHLPSDAEFRQLTDYISSDIHYCCDGNPNNNAKALASKTRWELESLDCTIGRLLNNNNATGFSALPAGDQLSYTSFVSSTASGSGYACILFLCSQYADARHTAGQMNFGASVRCVRTNSNIILTPPTVITSEVIGVSTTSATSGGDVSSDGGDDVTARGVCWSTSQNPTISDDHTSNGNGVGSFSSELSGLTPNTTYYVRAYAINSIGTAYGAQKCFTTQPLLLPTVSTSNVTSITDNTAITGGCVSNNGGANLTARGVCWSTSQNPTISDDHTSDGNGVGSFSSELSGLTPNTTYYVRAYATNSVGTAYGTQMSFTTVIGYPSVITTAVSNISQRMATSGGNVSSDGGDDVTSRGVCWSTSQNPTISNSHTNDGNGVGVFSSTLSGLTPNTTYYVRAYATNSVGTAYGAQKSFTTLALEIPTVTTTAVSNVMDSTATSGGNVSSDGGDDVTARGVCWSTSQNPTISNSHTNDGNGVGVFSSTLSGLIPDTTYYVRAYATNGIGTAYGNEVSFSTTVEACPGTPTITDVDGNVYNTVIIGTQCWMRENLKTTRYTDSTPIERGSDTSRSIGYWYYPDNNESYKDLCGLLYNRKAVMRNDTVSNSNPSNIQGICPTGWHVPSRSEWDQMFDYIMTQSQYYCGGLDYYIAKALASTSGWRANSDPCAIANNQSANNATGFGLFPAGAFFDNGYLFFSYQARCWSTSTNSNNRPSVCVLAFDTPWASIWNVRSYDAYSVRCLRDN